MVFGTTALLSKPALSLSPMFAVAILNSHGYGDLQKDKIFTASPELRHVMFLLICFYPIVVGAIQFISWSFYRTPQKSKEIKITI